MWSPDIWSPTICPQLIGPSGQTVPNLFGPHGQMVPKNLVPMDKWSQTNLVPLDKWSLEYSVCPGVQALGIQKYRDCIGWGPFGQEDQICWRQFVQGDRKLETGSPGIKWPNVSQPTRDIGKKSRFRSFKYSDNSIKNTVFMPFCSTSFVLPIWPKYGILNRVIRVHNLKVSSTVLSSSVVWI